MKILCLSDVHLTSRNPIARKDNLTVVQWNKLRYVLSHAKNNDAIVVQSGDFFNSARDWNVLYKMIEMLRKHDVPVLSIFGQHDQYFRSSTANNATTMGVLAELGLITLLDSDKPFTYADNDTRVDIYGCHWGEKLPTIATDNDFINMLVIHAPISEKRLFPKHIIIKPKTMLKRYRQFDFILCGDIHREFSIERGKQRIVNTGPLLRMEATDYNFNHRPCFYEYNPRTNFVGRQTIPVKPAEEVLERTHLDDEQITINEEKLDILAQAVRARYGKVNKLNIPKLIQKYNFGRRMKKVISEIYKDATE